MTNMALKVRLIRENIPAERHVKESFDIKYKNVEKSVN